MYRGNPSHSILKTKVITGLDMCKVCTEAVHRIAFWKQKLSQVVDMCKVCTEAVHREALDNESYRRFEPNIHSHYNPDYVCYRFIHTILILKIHTHYVSLHLCDATDEYTLMDNRCSHILLRSIKHVCKCKWTSSYPPHTTPPPHDTSCCVASNMCASANERHHPHPTPPHPHMKHPVA